MTNQKFFVESLLAEVAGTARLIRAVPQENWSFTHHERQRTAQQLIGHMVPHIDDVLEVLNDGQMNHRWFVDYATPEEAASHFEAVCQQVAEKVATIDDATWYEKICPMKINGNTVYEVPTFRLAWMMYTDLIHHRGQLSTYIRPMGGTMVPVYGPTFEMMQQATSSN